MSNKNRESRHVEAAKEATSAPSPAEQTQPVQAAAQPEAQNYVLTFKRNHPKNRASYGIAGVPGIVVIQRELFAGTVPFTSNSDLAGMPPTLMVDALLVNPKPDNKAAKAEAAAKKLAERAAKQAAKAEEMAKKLAEKQAKADAQLAAAKAKVEAAAAAAATKHAEPEKVTA